jgi:hypothetical protein
MATDQQGGKRTGRKQDSEFIRVSSIELIGIKLLIITIQIAVTSRYAGFCDPLVRFVLEHLS